MGRGAAYRLSITSSVTHQVRLPGRLQTRAVFAPARYLERHLRSGMATLDAAFVRQELGRCGTVPQSLQMPYPTYFLSGQDMSA